MDITGYDTEVPVGRDVLLALRRFVAQVRERWPEFLEQSTLEVLLAGDALALPFEFYFCKDLEMDAFSDEHAYTTNSTGEGCFMVMFSGHTFTLVTPGDPARDQFSAWLLHALRSAVAHE